MKERKELKVVKCQGTDYEIGQQFGEACREDFHSSVKNIYTTSEQHQISKEQIMANVNKFIPLVENFDPLAIEFIKGIAEGADISYKEAMMIRAGNELYYSDQISRLCTSFSATGKAVKNGKTLIGQTLDWTENNPVALLWIKRADGIEQLLLSSGCCVDYGLNSAGVGICGNEILQPQNAYKKLNLPVGCYLPKVMRQRTIGDALGVLCQVAHGILYYNLASHEGEIIGIESTFDDFKVMHPERDMLTHSNHYLTERFQKGDWGQLIPDTYIRIQRIRQLMDLNFGQLTPELMMEILADHHNYPNSICKHPDETKPLPHSATLATIIMVPSEGTMFAACGNPCDHEFVEYKLESMLHE